MSASHGRTRYTCHFRFLLASPLAPEDYRGSPFTILPTFDVALLDQSLICACDAKISGAAGPAIGGQDPGLSQTWY
jgi:hypothetical protein